MIKVQLRLLSIMLPHGSERSTGCVCTQALSLLTSASPEHATCGSRADQELPPPPKLQILSTGRPRHPRDPAPEFSRSPVHAPLHFDVGVLAPKWRPAPPKSAAPAPAAGPATISSGPPPSDGVQPKCLTCSFYRGSTPCQRRPHRRAALRAQSRHPAARLREFHFSSARGPPRHPSADRIPWAAFNNARTFQRPGAAPAQARRQHTPRARVTAPPPASPGRHLCRIRPLAARSPSSSQALGYESLMPPPVSHRHLHGFYRFWQLRLAPK
ncbi:hypothetical protein NDU88_002502 [Pleurodeles waltl]|uniref:Uncharacterized protein n=1 Tax=Pleurodeles waltl TaxID=8319 RepID=A0AAV7VAP5_PLEWA|nr:hypothetical protein NDU88_002502 [Pleurodeles waltl]